MATRTVSLEVPDELVAIVGGSTELVAEKAKQALVLQLLGEARISQGKAARLLGITRWDIIDLMALHRIPSGPQTAEEVDQETEVVRRLLEKSSVRARHQRQ